MKHLLRLFNRSLSLIPGESNLAPAWKYAQETFRLGANSPHGLQHWCQVERNALQLALSTGADRTVIRLFAILHDVAREDDMFDPDHGRRAAALLPALNHRLFHISEEQLSELQAAIAGHADGFCSDDPTIGTCWDADRLDLIRFGTAPWETLMSTTAGKQAALRHN